MFKLFTTGFWEAVARLILRNKIFILIVIVFLPFLAMLLYSCSMYLLSPLVLLMNSSRTYSSFVSFLFSFVLTFYNTSSISFKSRSSLLPFWIALYKSSSARGFQLDYSGISKSLRPFSNYLNDTRLSPLRWSASEYYLNH